MTLGDWCSRLREKTPLRVHGVLTEERAREASRMSGDAAFVSWAGDSAQASQVIGHPVAEDGVGPVRQVVASGVSVLLRIERARDGADRDLAQLEEARGAVQAALLGWQPPGAASVITFRQGRPVAVEGRGVQWWDDRYECDRLISDREAA